MIQGVKIKELKIIPDDRGFLMEILRCDDEMYERFGQLYMTGCKRGVVKGWHYHKEQTDHFACVSGRAMVVLYDNRSGSPTHGEVQEVILEAPPCDGHAPVVLKIPPLVLHGFFAFDCEEARIVNVPTIPYRYKNPDEFRYPWNSAEIPYRWPSYVTRGG